MATIAEMRMCRTIGHSWDAYDVVKESRSAFVVSLRCDRCGTIRSDVIDSHGFLVSRYYNYPTGYRDVDVTIGDRSNKRVWLINQLKQAHKGNVTPLKRKIG